MNRIFTSIFLLQGLFSMAYCGQVEVDRLNQILRNNHLPEDFSFEDGAIIFKKDSFSPHWAVKDALGRIGIVTGHGHGGIDPYKYYAEKEFKEGDLYHYMILRGCDKEVCDRLFKVRANKMATGIELLTEAKNNLGSELFKSKEKMEIERGERVNKIAQYSYFFKHQLIPLLVSRNFLFLAGFVATMVIIVPTIIRNTLPAIFNYFLVKRPTIIGPNDSDIYKNIIGRLFYKAPKLPKVIVNLELEEDLEKLIERNRIITQHNKKSKEKRKYIHALLYGQAGVGKTLFAKKLAEKSKMHYMYFSVADLSQMAEEEALQTLKELFVYAKSFHPCILIIDEADILFDKKDLKAQKIVVLFQKEFSKAINSKIQLIFITNYPNKFPSTMINRIGQILFFDAPTFETQKKLFALHLRLSKIKPEYIDRLVGSLGKKQIEGLVGRDIESISALLSLEKTHNEYALEMAIKKHKINKKNIEKFKMPEEKKEEKKKKSQQKKVKKKVPEKNQELPKEGNYWFNQ